MNGIKKRIEELRGVWVVREGYDEFAPIVYMNPQNRSDYLAGVHMNARQINNHIIDENTG